MIPADELADIRENATSALPDTCNVVNMLRTRDARGQVTEVAVTGPDFPCHLVPLGLAAEEQVQAGALQVDDSWHVVMPLDTIIALGDSIGVDVEGNAGLYEVVAGAPDESLAAYRVAIVRKAS